MAKFQLSRVSLPVPDRRSVLSGLLALAAPGVALAEANRKAAPRKKASPPPPPPLVTVLGDSITAGLGLSTNLALPARLQTALERMSIRARVLGLGVLGDTTGGGLARVDR